MRRLFLAVLFVPSIAAAQTPAVPADPVTLTLSRQSVQIIGAAVMELPYKVAAPIMNDLHDQVTKADEAAKAAAKVPPAAAPAEKPAGPAPVTSPTEAQGSPPAR